MSQTQDESPHHVTATDQDLIDAGLNPDDWRGHDGQIVGHDLEPGPLAEDVRSTTAAEAAELYSDGTKQWAADDDGGIW